MGLETVELVMEIEESFGIRIEDSEAERIQTVGQAYECILSKLNRRAEWLGDGVPHCASSTAFYRIRRAMMDTWATARSSIRPGTALDSLVPERDRGLAWARFDASLDLRLPALRRPDWLVESCFGFAILIAVLVALPLSLFHVAIAALSIPCAFAFLAITMQNATTRFATELPFATVADLVEAMVPRNFEALNARRDPEAVWFALRGIISETLDVPLEAVTKDASFVYDLGCD
jgi:acyl carrier protein